MTVYSVTNWLTKLHCLCEKVECVDIVKYKYIENEIYVFFNTLKTNGFSNVQSCSYEKSYEQCQYDKTRFYSELGVLIMRIFELYESDMNTDLFVYLHKQHKYVKNKFVEHGHKLCKIQNGNGICPFVKKIGAYDANKGVNQIKTTLSQFGINTDMLE